MSYGVLSESKELVAVSASTVADSLVPIEVAARGRHRLTRKTNWERPLKSSTTILHAAPEPGGRAGSKWGPSEKKPFLPPPFLEVPSMMTQEQVEQFFREQRLEDLNRKLLLGELEMGDPDLRAPSPPPVYDRDGNRTNTREARIKALMLAEQQSLIEHMVKKVPGLLPPTEFKPLKKIRRILIPQDEFPEYNFMGLIIGPRGCNHKRLEAESGTQISIRGRGTQKEGKRSDHQTAEEAAMPQHVHIAADTDEKLERAVTLIEPLLDPTHPIHEEYKKRGLEQLAAVTGTGAFLAKPDIRCTICGAVGHFGHQCPEASFDTYQRVDLKCVFCGDRGHVSMDCRLAAERGITPEQLLIMEAERAATQPLGSSMGGGWSQMNINKPPPPAGTF